MLTAIILHMSRALNLECQLDWYRGIHPTYANDAYCIFPLFPQNL